MPDQKGGREGKVGRQRTRSSDGMVRTSMNDRKGLRTCERSGSAEAVYMEEHVGETNRVQR